MGEFGGILLNSPTLSPSKLHFHLHTYFHLQSSTGEILCLFNNYRSAHRLYALQSMQESEAKGLQTYTQQQVAKQARDISKAGIGQQSCLDCASQGLHSTELRPISPPSPEDDTADDSQPDSDCADDSRPNSDCADDSQPEDDGTDDSQPSSDCADDSQPEDDCAVDSQLEDVGTDDSQSVDKCADEPQPEDNCTGGHGEAVLNWSGCEDEEERVFLKAVADYDDEDTEGDLCLSLSSDEEG